LQPNRLQTTEKKKKKKKKQQQQQQQQQSPWGYQILPLLDAIGLSNHLPSSLDPTGPV